MPSVAVEFLGKIIRGAVTRHEFMTDLREIIARNMEGLGYEGEALGLVGDDVDVILRPYEEGDVLSGSVFMLEIHGYDYPGRMDPELMHARLTSIATEVHDLVNPYVSRALADYEGEADDQVPARNQHLVSVKFISYRQGSWASSS